tara:strand:- start:241 stop:405 length:165 start_codon:yes stop_codon:yes gene_type:complete
MDERTNIKRTIDMLLQMEQLLETINSCLKQNKKIPTEIIIIAKKIEKPSEVNDE